MNHIAFDLMIGHLNRRSVFLSVYLEKHRRSVTPSLLRLAAPLRGFRFQRKVRIILVLNRRRSFYVSLDLRGVVLLVMTKNEAPL
jgi:hypothetical protein